MRLATLNVGGPSEQRAEQLLRYLPTLDSDVLVLSETRPNAGTFLLLDGLRQAGWELVDNPISSSRERGVAIAVRESVDVRRLSPRTSVTLAHRFAAATVGRVTPVTVFGVYVPSRDASALKIERKQRFLEELADVVRGGDAVHPLVLLGDLNVIGRSHVPKYSTFRSWEYALLDAFEDAGLTNAHARLHPSAQAHSWIGRKGAGYCYDYAFVSPSLANAVVGCSYDHEPRLARLTDHAAVVLTLDDSSLGHLGGSPVGDRNLVPA